MFSGHPLLPCEDTVNTAVCEPRSAPHQTPNLPGPQLWLPSLRNCEKYMSVVHKPPGYSALSEQSRQTTTAIMIIPGTNKYKRRLGVKFWKVLIKEIQFGDDKKQF